MRENPPAITATANAAWARLSFNNKRVRARRIRSSTIAVRVSCLIIPYLLTVRVGRFRFPKKRFRNYSGHSRTYILETLVTKRDEMHDHELTPNLDALRHE